MFDLEFKEQLNISFEFSLNTTFLSGFCVVTYKVCSYDEPDEERYTQTEGSPEDETTL